MIGPDPGADRRSGNIASMAQADNLKLTVSDDGATVVADGQIDSHTSQALDEALSAAPAERATSLDLANVSFIDSSGLRVIVRSHKRHIEFGGRLMIESPSEPVTRLLEITGLTSQLQITPNPAP
jgi:anti-sigma B factor antagonist